MRHHEPISGHCSHITRPIVGTPGVGRDSRSFPTPPSVAIRGLDLTAFWSRRTDNRRSNRVAAAYHPVERCPAMPLSLGDSRIPTNHGVIMNSSTSEATYQRTPPNVVGRSGTIRASTCPKCGLRLELAGAVAVSGGRCDTRGDVTPQSGLSQLSQADPLSARRSRSQSTVRSSCTVRSHEVARGRRCGSDRRTRTTRHLPKKDAGLSLGLGRSVRTGSRGVLSRVSARCSVENQ